MSSPQPVAPINLRFVLGSSQEFLIPVFPNQLVAAVKADLAQRAGLAASDVQLASNGVLWPDEATIQQISPVAFSIVNVAVVSARPPPAQAAPVAAQEQGGEFLAPSEVAQAIVITGIPLADPGVTEGALLSLFQGQGQVLRMMFQDDGSGAQRAMVVFARPSAADAALACDGVPLLGSPVHVVPASSLPREAASGASGSPVAGSLEGSEAVASVAHLLAQGFLAGERGLSQVRRYGDERGVTSQVRVVWDSAVSTASSVNSRYQVVPTVAAVATAAIESAREVDRQYRLSQKGKALVEGAVEKGKEVLNQYPAAARVVHSGMGFLGSALRAANTAVFMARDEVMGHHIQQHPHPQGQGQGQVQPPPLAGLPIAQVVAPPQQPLTPVAAPPHI